MPINQQTRELADIIAKEHLVYNPESQALETKKEAIDAAMTYMAGHGADIDAKQLEAAFKVTNVFTAASALATGEVAIDAMAKHKEIQSLSANFHISKGVSAEHLVTREYISRTPPKEKGGEATEVVKHGRIESTLTIQDSKDARSRGGQHKHIRDFMYELGAEKLCK